MFRRLWVRITAPYTGCTFFTYICCINCNDVCLKRGRGEAFFLINRKAKLHSKHKRGYDNIGEIHFLSYILKMG